MTKEDISKNMKCCKILLLKGISINMITILLEMFCIYTIWNLQHIPKIIGVIFLLFPLYWLFLALHNMIILIKYYLLVNKISKYLDKDISKEN